MSGPLKPLPIMDTVAEVYRGFFAHLGYLPRLALLPFTISFGLNALVYLTDGGLARFVLELAGIFPVALFGYLWHRLLLFGPAPQTLNPLPSFDETFRRFLLYTALLVVPLMLLQAAMPPPPPPGADPAEIAEQSGTMFFLLPLLIVYILAVIGLSFLFPATAAGKRYGPGEAWQDARGVKFALFTIVLLTLIPVQVLTWLLLIPVGTMEASTGLRVPSLLVITAATYVALPLSTGVLTQAYKTRFDWTPPPPSTT